MAGFSRVPFRVSSKLETSSFRIPRGG